MAGYCGMCGTPRPDGAAFCMQCGAKLPHEVHKCPTCGQDWPAGERGGPANTVAVATRAVIDHAGQPDMVVPSYVRGAYSSSAGIRYFDGAGWFGARELPGGIWIPDPEQPVTMTGGADLSLSLVYQEPGTPYNRAEVSGASSEPIADPSLPRGPSLGPDYRPERDCGNCGFELVMDGLECGKCGSRNTGPVFRPGG